MNSALILTSLAQMVSGQIGNCLAGGMVILLLAALCAHLLRRESSGVRYGVWFAGLVAVAGIPVVALVWPLQVQHPASILKPETAAITLPGSWALYFFLAWSIIVSISLARIAAGFWRVWVLRRRSAVLDTNDLAPELRETLAQFRPSRDVAILLSDKVHSPTALGLMSPAIVLPKWLLEELSAAELRQIFLHELAHLRRWDDWSNLLQKIVKGLFFFHPAVWWIERQVSLEREMACDEAVLAQTGNARAYAQCLVLLAEKNLVRRSVMLAQAAVSRVGQTSLRVARILSAGRQTNTGMRKLIVPFFAAALIASLACLARAPRLVAFESVENEAGPIQALAVAPRAPGLPAAASFGSAVGTVSGNTLAKFSSSSLRPLVVGANCRRLEMPLRTARSEDPVVEAKLGLEENYRRTTAETEGPSSEIVVVVVQTSWNGYAAPAVWQIQMWHFTVLRSSKNPVRQATPQKVI
jgi:beta-lactamase regulating signal transducer with metallopeptidase domain